MDLDDDTDMDLIVISDFAGLDLYLNNGQGQFTDVTDTLVRDRHLFGMTHTFGDYDLDGNLEWLRGLTFDYPNARTSLGIASSLVIAGGVLVAQV